MQHSPYIGPDEGRIHALQMAQSHHSPGFDGSGATPSEIVRTAALFEAFIRGYNTTADQLARAVKELHQEEDAYCTTCNDPFPCATWSKVHELMNGQGMLPANESEIA